MCFIFFLFYFLKLLTLFFYNESANYCSHKSLTAMFNNNEVLQYLFAKLKSVLETFHYRNLVWRVCITSNTCSCLIFVRTQRFIAFRVQFVKSSRLVFGKSWLCGL